MGKTVGAALGKTVGDTDGASDVGKLDTSVPTGDEDGLSDDGKLGVAEGNIVVGTAVGSKVSTLPKIISFPDHPL